MLRRCTSGRRAISVKPSVFIWLLCYTKTATNKGAEPLPERPSAGQISVWNLTFGRSSQGEASAPFPYCSSAFFSFKHRLIRSALRRAFLVLTAPRRAVLVMDALVLDALDPAAPDSDCLMPGCPGSDCPKPGCPAPDCPDSDCPKPGCPVPDCPGSLRRIWGYRTYGRNLLFLHRLPRTGDRKSGLPVSLFVFSLPFFPLPPLTLFLSLLLFPVPFLASVPALFLTPVPAPFLSLFPAPLPRKAPHYSSEHAALWMSFPDRQCPFPSPDCPGKGDRRESKLFRIHKG